MDIKYTADGKKVVVIGKLNNSESIVQEIHVSAIGTELPAGDNFVASNLLNAPMRTWKENRIEEIDKKYDDALVKWEEEYSTLKKKHEKAVNLLHDKISHIEFFQKNISVEPFKTLISFMENRITHLVEECYGEYKILTFDEVMRSQDDDIGYGGLKLLTLFGAKNTGNGKYIPASFFYGVNRYKDGSGNNTYVYPAESYEECLKIISRLINTRYAERKNKIDDGMIKACEKYNLEIFPKSEVIEYYKKVYNDILTNIKYNDKKHNEHNEKLKQDALTILSKIECD